MNVVILDGKVVQPIKPISYYFYTVIQHDREMTKVYIPKKMYRTLPEKVKAALRKTNEYVLVEGFIDNGVCEENAQETAGQYRIIADIIRPGRQDNENLVIINGIVCDIESQTGGCIVKVGLLEGRHMIVVTGSIACNACRNCPKDGCKKFGVSQMVKFVGKIKDKKIIFTKYSMMSKEVKGDDCFG